MSIVEKAVRKRRGAAKGPSEEQPAAHSIDDSVPSAASAPQSRGAPSNRPAHSLRVDRERLESLGMMPGESHSKRLVNEYRHIKRPLIEYLAAEEEGRSRAARLANRIMITSAVPGEGKSFTAVNLAQSLALEREYEVILVDGDIFKCTTTDAFGLRGKPGLGDLLADESLPVESVVYETDLSGMWVMPAGRNDPLLAEHLASRRADQVLTHLARMRPHQIIVLDSPPLLPTAEARIMAARAGQVVLVVQAGKTAEQTVLQALDVLKKEQRVNLLLNQAEMTGRLGYYDYYSGYYERTE